MSGDLIVHRDRTNVVTLGLGIPVDGDTITSQIRRAPGEEGAPLAEWTVAFTTDGADGEITLTLPHTAVADITDNYAWMDLKRVSGGEPLSVFLEPLRVKFQGVVTV
jgi:hypothetical protein